MKPALSSILCVLVALLILFAARPRSDAWAQDAAVDPLVVASADSLDLARAAARVGDRGVLTRLRSPIVSTQLAAIHATPFMRDPVAALGPLGTLARGRDPDLAPAAAQAAATIARSLTLIALAHHEVMRSEIAQLASVYAQLGADTTARADIRAAALVVASKLRGLAAG